MTRINNTRSSELIEKVMLEKKLNIHLKNKMLFIFLKQLSIVSPTKNMTLGWLRMTLKGQDDVKHIGKKTARRMGIC
jgi:hypothetical protein